MRMRPPASLGHSTIWVDETLLSCTCGGFQPASPFELTTSRTEAPQARRSCAGSLVTFTQSFLHCADAFILMQRMVASVFSTLFIYPKYLVETKQAFSITHCARRVTLKAIILSNILRQKWKKRQSCDPPPRKVEQAGG